MTSSCTGKLGLRDSGEHTSSPNLASRNNVAHNQPVYTIPETLPTVTTSWPKAKITLRQGARR
jgi:hypothetical protein